MVRDGRWPVDWAGPVLSDLYKPDDQVEDYAEKNSAGIGIEFIIRRNQKDTIGVPFSRTGYLVKIQKINTNLYQVNLKKKIRGRHRDGIFSRNTIYSQDFYPG